MEEDIKKNYFNLNEIIEEHFKGFLSNEKLLDYIKQDKIIGKKIDKKWHIPQSELPKLQELVISENMKFTNKQIIDLTSELLHVDGRVLDIGGGGEGVIGQHLGESVVSIDFREDELMEALENGDSESLKIIMDARDLKFLDNSFDMATAFFSLLYIPLDDLDLVFEEIHRVLKKGSKFIVWDLYIPKNVEMEKKLYGIPLKIQIDGKMIETSYGVKWNEERDIEKYIEFGKKANFDLLNKQKNQNTFKIELIKV